LLERVEGFARARGLPFVKDVSPVDAPAHAEALALVIGALL
jgi:hypothetical protein